MATDSFEHEAWPLRAALLASLGAAFGLAIHFLTDGPEVWQWTENPVRLGAAASLAAGGIVFGFTLERARWRWSAAFALAAGLVVGFVTYWNGQPESWGAGEGWQLFSALLAVAVAAPLFQASRDEGRRSFDYRAVHAHAWTNIVLWGVAWAFVGASFLLAFLLSELFQLIGIGLLRDLLNREWFGWVLGGTALGAAVGVLRDRDKILATLQRVATAVLSILAPALALGLVLFVAALPFTGLKPLWDQTSATTPILLACILGAVGLANAAIGNSAEEESRARLVRWAAAALCAVLLPLAVVASVSTGKRIAQYGLTPDRLWAAVFVGIALATALAYLYALVRGRSAWAEHVRAGNIRLALGVCALALFLALPIVSFGALSTSDQVSRLRAGRITPDRFDWAALRYDFGPAGRRAVERLARSAHPRIREHAAAALAAKSRWDARRQVEDFVEAPRSFRAFPAGTQVPPDLAEAVLGRPGKPGFCRGKGECFLFWKAGDPQAVLIVDRCSAVADDRRGRLSLHCLDQHILVAQEGRWAPPLADEPVLLTEEQDKAEDARRRAEEQRRRQAVRSGQVEVREVTRRQVFIGGEPVGDTF